MEAARLEADQRIAAERVELYDRIKADRLAADKARLVERQQAEKIEADKIAADRLKEDVELELEFAEADRRLTWLQDKTGADPMHIQYFVHCLFLKI